MASFRGGEQKTISDKHYKSQSVRESKNQDSHTVMTERRTADLSKQLGADCWLSGIVCVCVCVCVCEKERQIVRKKRDSKTGCVLGKTLPCLPVMHFSPSHNWILKIHGAALYMWCQVDSRHLPLFCFCGLFLCSLVFLLPSLHTHVLLIFALSFIFHRCLCSLGTLNKESKMSIAVVTYRGADKDANLLDQEIWELDRGGWLQAVFKGLERTRLKLDFQLYVFLRQQEHGRPLKIMSAGIDVLCRVVQLIFFFPSYSPSTLNSCFVYYFAVLLPRSHGCHGLLSKLFHLYSNAKSH